MRCTNRNSGERLAVSFIVAVRGGKHPKRGLAAGAVGSALVSAAPQLDAQSVPSVGALRSIGPISPQTCPSGAALSPEVFRRTQIDHGARLTRLESVMNELEQLAESISTNKTSFSRNPRGKNFDLGPPLSFSVQALTTPVPVACGVPVTRPRWRLFHKILAQSGRLPKKLTSEKCYKRKWICSHGYNCGIRPHAVSI